MHPEMERSFNEVLRAMDLARANSPMRSAHALSEPSGPSGVVAAVASGSAKERRIRAAIAELREKRDSCGLHSLTFVPYMHKLTPEQLDQAEADLQYRFRLWWDSWIRTQINAIEAELPNVQSEPTAATAPESP